MPNPSSQVGPELRKRGHLTDYGWERMSEHLHAIRDAFDAATTTESPGARLDRQIEETLNEMLSAYEFAARDCGDRLVLKLAASEATRLVAHLLDRVSDRYEPGPCEECGEPSTLWCCDDHHAPLCQTHYESMCRRMEADPIHCPLRSEMMRSRPAAPQGGDELRDIAQQLLDANACGILHHGSGIWKDLDAALGTTEDQSDA